MAAGLFVVDATTQTRSPTLFPPEVRWTLSLYNSLAAPPRYDGARAYIPLANQQLVAYDLTAEAWRGDIDGRRPRLTHEKALIIQTTIFDKRAYDGGLRDAMRMVIDEFTLSYPGIKHVEHEYFYAVHGADDATRRGYLERAYALGRQF